MTFYKKLQKALYNKGKGSFILVEENGGKYYYIFSPIKDSRGKYRHSGWWMTEEQAKENIGRYFGYIEDEINELAQKKNWKIIKTYSLKDIIQL